MVVLRTGNRFGGNGRLLLFLLWSVLALRSARLQKDQPMLKLLLLAIVAVLSVSPVFAQVKVPDYTNTSSWKYDECDRSVSGLIPILLNLSNKVKTHRRLTSKGCASIIHFKVFVKRGDGNA